MDCHTPHSPVVEEYGGALPQVGRPEEIEDGGRGRGRRGPHLLAPEDELLDLAGRVVLADAVLFGGLEDHPPEHVALAADQQPPRRLRDDPGWRGHWSVM